MGTNMAAPTHFKFFVISHTGSNPLNGDRCYNTCKVNKICGYKKVIMQVFYTKGTIPAISPSIQYRQEVD